MSRPTAPLPPSQPSSRLASRPVEASTVFLLAAAGNAGALGALGALGGAVAWAVAGPQAALGFTLGVMIALASALATALVCARAQASAGVMAGAFVAKMVAIGGLFTLLAHTGSVPIVPAALGLACAIVLSLAVDAWAVLGRRVALDVAPCGEGESVAKGGV